MSCDTNKTIVQMIAVATALSVAPMRAFGLERSAGATGFHAALEAQPLAGFVGQFSARAEAMVWRELAVAFAFEKKSAAGERAGFRDELTKQGVEAVYYPFSDLGKKLGGGASLSHLPFVALGARQETVDLGRETPRDTNTWVRTDADSLNDRWSEHDTYWTSTQTLGYRLVAGRLATASLRLTRDEVMTASTHVAADDVRSFDASLSSKRREPVRLSIQLFGGLILP